MTRRSAMLLASILFVPAVATAQTVYWTDRPIVLPKGVQEASVDLSVGLNKGALGEDFGIASGLPGDRFSGLHFHGGLLKNFEMGISLQFVYSMHQGSNYVIQPAIPVEPSRLGRFSDVTGLKPAATRAPKRNPGPEGDGTRRIAGYPYRLAQDQQGHLNPLLVYARYAVLPQLGVELALIVPTQQYDGNNRPGFRLGLPFQWIFSPGLLSMHIRPDLIIGFAKPGDDFGQPDSTVLLSYYVDAGITLCLVGAFLDITLGYGGDAYPYKRGYLPMSFVLGYTVSRNLDLFAGVSLDNLVPKTGKASDARRLTLGTAVRF